MKTSLIIPSYNPVLKLPATLDSLVTQSAFINELIIIIDNENYTDFATSLVEKYSGVFNMKVFPQVNSGRGKSRNRGVELCTGDIIMFLDDDMLAGDGLIEKHISFHVQNPGSIISGNGYRNPADANYSFGKFLVDMESGWITMKKDISRVTLQKFNFTACNLSMPKSIFEKLSGFDTRFSDGEDFDFAVRAIHANIPVFYDISLLAWHNDWPDFATFIMRQKEYAKAKKEIFTIHPEYLANFSAMLPEAPGSGKKMLSRILKFLLTRFVASDNTIFAALPVGIRFKLYQLAIAANTYA